MKSSLPFILIALSIALFFLYTQPEYGTISDLSAKKTQYESALSRTKQLVSLRDNLLSQYNAISPADKTKLESMIPAQFDSVKLVSDINTVAAQHSMSIKGIKITPASAGTSQPQGDLTAGAALAAPYATGEISFTASGTYQNFVLFLKDIESSQELLDVRKISISSSKSVTGISSGTFDFGVDVQTYFIN